MLSWSASQRGHYAETTLAPLSETTLDIGVGTYYDANVKAFKMAVANHQSRAAIEIYFDSEPVIFVQPYTNIALDCYLYRKCRIVNRGNKRLTLRFIDKAMFDSSPSLFASYPIAAAASLNDLLFHFDDTVDNNDGGEDVGVESIAGNSLNASNVKFGAASLDCQSAGLIAGHTDFIDTAGDFTCDAWFKIQAATWTVGHYRYLFQLGDGLSSVVIYAKIYRDSANTAQIKLLQGAGASLGASFAFDYSGSADFIHIALTKKSSDLYLFVNGVQRHTIGASITGLRSSVMLAAGTVSADHAPIKAYIDEWRFVNSICQWTSTFTPPTSPYL